MNFVSHYHFDHLQGRHHHNLGLILPDLMGISQRGWKLTEGMPTGHLLPVHEMIYKGVLTHLDMDRFFHSSVYFRKYNEILKNTLTGRGIENPPYRMFFVTHVLLEILLDRQIVMHYRPVLDQLYDDLDQIADDDITTFFSAMDQQVPDRFILFFHRFRNDRYLYRYEDTESVLFALNRIFERAGQPVFGEQLYEPLINCIFELDGTIHQSMKELNSELNRYMSR